jgi:hypothetical protein
MPSSISYPPHRCQEEDKLIGAANKRLALSKYQFSAASLLAVNERRKKRRKKGKNFGEETFKSGGKLKFFLDRKERLWDPFLFFLFFFWWGEAGGMGAVQRQEEVDRMDKDLREVTDSGGVREYVKREKQRQLHEQMLQEEAMDQSHRDLIQKVPQDLNSRAKKKN